jgi:hypothetical protein
VDGVVERAKRWPRRWRGVREEIGIVGARPGRLAHPVEVDVRRPERLQGGPGEATPYLARATSTNG